MGTEKQADNAAAATDATPPRSFPVAAIGASAGGLGPTVEVLRHLGADPGLAVVVIHHLDPSHESELVPILSRTTADPRRGRARRRTRREEPRLRRAAERGPADRERHPRARSARRGGRAPPPHRSLLRGARARPDRPRRWRRAQRKRLRRHRRHQGHQERGWDHLRSGRDRAVREHAAERRQHRLRRLHPHAGGDRPRAPPHRPEPAGLAAEREPRRRRARLPAHPHARAKGERRRLRQLQALDPPPSGAAPRLPPAPRRSRRVPRGPEARPRGGHGALRGDAHPRDRVLPRARVVRGAEAHGLPEAARGPPRRRSTAHLGARLLDGRGGLLDRDEPPRVPRGHAPRGHAGEDLRHRPQPRHRREGARGHVRREHRARCLGGAAATLLHEGVRRLPDPPRRTGHVRLREARRHARPAVLRHGSRQLPEPDDLPRSRAAGPRRRPSSTSPSRSPASSCSAARRRCVRSPGSRRSTARTRSTQRTSAAPRLLFDFADATHRLRDGDGNAGQPEHGGRPRLERDGHPARGRSPRARRVRASRGRRDRRPRHPAVPRPDGHVPRAGAGCGLARSAAHGSRRAQAAAPSCLRRCAHEAKRGSRAGRRVHRERRHAPHRRPAGRSPSRSTPHVRRSSSSSSRTSPR